FGVAINRLVNSPFNSFWAPRRMELLLSDNAEAKRTVARIATYAVACLCYTALLLSAGIESLIEIIADPTYKGAHVVVPFVALSYVLLGLEMHFSAGILHQKKTKWVSYITFLSVPVVLAWNYLCIPQWGLIGAATSNLAGGVVRVVLIYIVSQRFYFIPFELGRIAQLFATAFVLYLFAQTITFHSPWATFFGRLFIVGSLPLLLFPMRFYHDGELDYARGLVAKGKDYLGVALPKKSSEDKY
ncbi:MAG: polysaccharide biosynthesis C-terminal domain-containing protein, partial [Desulfobulbaceae bacterium]|nr:polysaccharide biosynthesis C-terminal domain-containing protein [Desulfobulbaceae bacterium]